LPVGQIVFAVDSILLEANLELVFERHRYPSEHFVSVCTAHAFGLVRPATSTHQAHVRWRAAANSPSVKRAWPSRRRARRCHPPSYPETPDWSRIAGVAVEGSPCSKPVGCP
jgi:hypothetical protein